MKYFSKFFRRSSQEKEVANRKTIYNMLKNQFGYRQIGQCYSPLVCRCYFLEDGEGRLCLLGETTVLSSDYDLIQENRRFTDICIVDNCPEIEKRIKKDKRLSRVLDMKFKGATYTSMKHYLEGITQQSSSPSSGEQS